MHPASKVRLQCSLQPPISTRGQDDVLLDEMTRSQGEDEVTWIMRHEGKLDLGIC